MCVILSSQLHVSTDLHIVLDMFNSILLPSFYTRSCPLRGSRSTYTPTAVQTNIAIFISAEGNYCKGTDPAENGALMAVPLKSNVIATDKPHLKEHREQNPVLSCMVYGGAGGLKDYTEHDVCVRYLLMWYSK